MDVQTLRHEVARLNTIYERFGATEGARALKRVLDLLDEHYEDPDRMPMQLVFRELADARTLTL